MYIELKTERLLLRPLNVSDLQTVNEYATDAENTKYMIYLPNKSIEETYKFLDRVSAEWQKEEPSFYEFAILYNSVHIGAVSVYLNEDKSEGELGWILNKSYWGNGFATESAYAVKEFAIYQLKVKTIMAHCDSRNLSSAHVMERIGLSFESKGERQYFDKRGLAGELKYSYSISEE
ncbi:MAG: GNAT family N-acetyltransferase [Eubacteriales bacterium]|nr:GNAT family N-acetyltransferase [Eubacteriales bacterium]